MRMVTLGCVLCLGTALTAAQPARISEPLDLIPADTMLAWYGRPIPEAGAADAGPSAINTFLSMADLAGQQLDRGARLNLSILKAAAEMVRYRHVLALIDTSARQAGVHPDSRQLDDVKLVFVVEAGKDAGRFRRIVQDTINEQTSKATARIDDQTASGFEYDRLVDARLPAWAEVGLGQIGPYFIVTLGTDVWPRIARVAAGEATSLAGDPWVTETRGARGRNALIEIFVDSAMIETKLDGELNGRVTQFFEAWDAGAMERGHWALGIENNTLYCIAHFMLDGQSVRRVYADPEIRNPQVLALIPDGARRAVYKVPAATVLRNLVAGLYVWQAEETREAARRRWHTIQREYGFDVQKEVLDNLGDTVILHNAPRHPLRLPIFFTTIVEIERNHAQVQATLNKMCRRWQEAVAKAMEEDGVSDPAVIHENNGIWSIQVGPFDVVAWTVTDRYLVISWSPVALRQYLTMVGDALRQPLEGPRASVSGN